jgi:hypothetical protein
LSADGAISVIFDVLRGSWLAMNASFVPKLPRKVHPSSSQLLMEILVLIAWVQISLLKKSLDGDTEGGILFSSSICCIHILNSNLFIFVD